MFKRLTVKRSGLNDKEVVATGQFRKKGSTVKNWKIRNYILTQDKMLMYFDPNSNNDKEKGSLLLDYDFSVLEGKKSNINESVNSCGALDNEIGVALSIQISKKTLELVFQSVDDTVNFIAGLMQITESPIYLSSYKSICTYLTLQKANDPKRWENHILKLFDKPIKKSDEKIEVYNDSVLDVNNSDNSIIINNHIDDTSNQSDNIDINRVSDENVIGVKEVDEINNEVTANESIIVDEKVDNKVDNISDNPIDIYNSDFTIDTTSDNTLLTNNAIKVGEKTESKVSYEASTTSDQNINEQLVEDVKIERNTNEQFNESQMNLSLSKSLTDEDYDYNDRFSASTNKSNRLSTYQSNLKVNNLNPSTIHSINDPIYILNGIITSPSRSLTVFWGSHLSWVVLHLIYDLIIYQSIYKSIFHFVLFLVSTVIVVITLRKLEVSSD